MARHQAVVSVSMKLIRAWWLLACLFGIALGEENSPYYPFPDKKDTPEAYVTLLYGDRFLLGARVLGQSIKDSGTTRCAHVLELLTRIAHAQAMQLSTAVLRSPRTHAYLNLVTLPRLIAEIWW
jgi:hypothetical protein